MGILFLLLLTPIVISSARTFRGDFNPAKIFCYFWVFQIILMSFVFFPLLRLTYVGQIYILFCLMAFLVGSNLGTGYHISPPKKPAIQLLNIKRLKIVLIFLIIMGFASTLYNVLSHGFSFSQLLDFSELLNMNNEMSVQRYSGAEESRSVISQFFGIFASLCPLVGGFSFLLVKKKLSLFSLFPSICSSLTSGAKMGVITAFALFVSGIFVSSSVYHIKLNIQFRNVLYTLVGTLVFFSVLILSMMFRIGAFDVETLQIVAEKFIAYSLGHLPAFDSWFTFNIINYNPDYTLGTQTFLGFFHYLGFVDRAQGLYQDFVEISRTGGQTNVYTVFRIFVGDFGIIGTLVWCCLMGALTQIIYRNLCANNKPERCIALMAGVYFFTFWSFVTSIFVYTTYFALLIMFYIVMVFCCRNVRRNYYAF